MNIRRLITLAIFPVLSACGGSNPDDGPAVQSIQSSASEASAPVAKAGPDTAALQLLGKHVFFDSISNPPRQACVSCHVPEMGWTGKVPAVNKRGVAIPGANPHTVGGRKPPASAYAKFSPPFGTVNPPGITFIPDGAGCSLGIGPFCVGGVFWDGRAEGRGTLGPVFPGATASVGQEIFGGLDGAVATSFAGFLGPLADQALGPFGNDVEQNVPPNPNDPAGLDGATSVCEHVKSAKYAELYSKAYGGVKLDCSAASVGTSFKRIALAISAWQHSDEVSPFNSARDKCAKDSAGNIVFPCAGLSDQANLGHDIFYGLNTTGRNRLVNNVPLNANCAVCHNSGRSAFAAQPSTGNEPRQLYTDHAYHNIGLPPNFEIENFNPSDPDPGIGRHADPANPLGNAMAGHVKTPTLRNVDKRRGNVAKAYMHNGYFKTLEDVVHFYNTAAEPAKVNAANCAPGTTAAQARARNCWPAPEISNATSRGLLFGRLGLTPQEEAALVAYMKSFSDTSDVKAPSPYKPTGDK